MNVGTLSPLVFEGFVCRIMRCIGGLSYRGSCYHQFIMHIHASSLILLILTWLIQCMLNIFYVCFSYRCPSSLNRWLEEPLSLILPKLVTGCGLIKVTFSVKKCTLSCGLDCSAFCKNKLQTSYLVFIMSENYSWWFCRLTADTWEYLVYVTSKQVHWF